MRVLVVGGGIGGLALAMGLRRRGIDVAVVDRDHDVSATGGYHITLDERAQAALELLGGADVLRRLRASGSALCLRERDAFWDRRGRLLGHGPELGGSTAIDVDRITLRTVLAEAVGADLRLGRMMTGIDQLDDVPRALFADGTTESADLLVGADGTHSVVARHLAGRRTNRPTGLIGFCGRTKRAELSPAEQQRLGPRSGMVVGPWGAALYVGYLDPVGNAALDAPELSRSVTTEPTYIWGAMLPESTATDALRELHGAELRAALVAEFRQRRWAADTLEVLTRSAPETVAAFRFNAASPRAADLAPWPAGRITALGDAVHATPPTAGMGAGAAIRDAAALVDQLATVDDPSALPAAVARFETDLRHRGAEVLTLALRTVHWILATNTPAGAALTTLATPILAAAASLREARTRAGKPLSA